MTGKSRSRAMRWLYIGTGHLLVAIGVIALAIPLLPTTPFLLLALGCYSRGSDRFHDWLLYRSWFGPYLRNSREGRGLSRGAKISLIAMALAGMLGSVLFFAPKGWGQWLAVAISATVIFFVWRAPSRKPGP